MNPTTSSQALSNLQSFQSGMQKPEDILNSQEQQLGVPQATQQVQGLRQAIQNTTSVLNNVAPSVYGRTQNSLETDAQANRNIQNEQAPISANLSKENTDYGNQESDLQNLLSKSGTLASLQTQGQDSQLGYLQNIYNDLFGSEQAKQASDLEQQKLAEQAREANLSASSSASSASANNAYLSSLLGGGSSSNPSTSVAQLSPQDAAYKDVQSRLSSGNMDQILSDYKATLKSANYGNTTDKAKIALYNQYVPSLKSLASGGLTVDGSNVPGLTF